MMMIESIAIGLAVIVWLLHQRFPLISVKGMPEPSIDQKKYCVIDIRDFITSNRNPIAEAENIPLSYLGRSTKEQAPCNKDILFVGHDYQSVKMAAKIVKKHAKHQRGFYYTLV